jgi:small subunit ribosomal protein S9
MAEEKKEAKPEAGKEAKAEAKEVKKVENVEKKEEKKPEAKPAVKPEAKPAKAKPKPVPQPAQEAKPVEEKKKRKKKKLKIKAIHTKAKKKTAVARASLKKGTGKFRVNKLALKLIKPYYLLEFVREPLDMADEALVNSVNVDVNVKGGGFMAQAIATRGAIAKALVEFSKDKKLKEKYLKYDRMLLVDDARYKEAKKPLGSGARRKKQSSKR